MKNLFLLLFISLNLKPCISQNVIEYSYTDGINKEDKRRENFIDQLKENESFTLNFQTVGCFHSAGYQLIFSREQGKHYVTYNEEKIELNGEQLNNIEKFERRLHSISKLGGCTTVDHYELIYKESTFRVADGTCRWNGFNELIDVLNIKLEK